MGATGISWSDIEAYIPILTNGGVAGIWIVCWLKGLIVSPRERDDWKDLYNQEREAHERTREALRLASERGESTTEALHLVAGVMNAVRTQGSQNVLPEATRARSVRRGKSSSDGS